MPYQQTSLLCQVDFTEIKSKVREIVAEKKTMDDFYYELQRQRR